MMPSPKLNVDKVCILFKFLFLVASLNDLDLEDIEIVYLN